MNAAHFHLALNHLPILGIPAGCLLLAWGMLRKNDAFKQASLALFVVAALIAIPIYLTGTPSVDLVHTMPGVNPTFIERHQETAKMAIIGAILLGLASLTGLILFRKARPAPKWFAILIFLVGMGVGALMLWTANLGGQIRHTEIRANP